MFPLKFIPAIYLSHGLPWNHGRGHEGALMACGLTSHPIAVETEPSEGKWQR